MKFALISNPRTGSSALCNYLRDTGVFVFHEPFRPSKGFHSSIGYSLKYLYNREGMDGIKHVTTHLAFDHNRAILEWLVAHNIKIVGLRRRSTVWMAISLAIAKQTDIWEVRRSDPQAGLEYDNGKMDVIPIGTIKEYFSLLSDFDTLFENYRKHMTMIYYEDLFSGDLRLTGRWIDCLFILLKLEKPTYYKKLIPEHFSASLKHNQWNTYHKIPNWNEIKEEFNIHEG